MGGSSNTTTTTSGGGGGSGGKDKDKGKDAPAAFMEGDRVLAYHGPLLYEAKVPPSLPRSSPSPARYNSIAV
jgi:mortality factor 4-like protein 1